MIDFIRGNVAAFGTDWIIVDNNGIGYRMSYPHPESLVLNKEVQVFTYLNVTQDGISLFGFENREEQELFLRLISVKGLGPKTAVKMLAQSPYDAIIQAVETGNVSFLKGMPGIGAKTASQIVLDLKGKLVQKEAEVPQTAEVQDALDALKNLGYKTGDINAAANRMNEEPGLTSDQYLRLGLQFLMKKKIGG